MREVGAIKQSRSGGTRSASATADVPAKYRRIARQVKQQCDELAQAMGHTATERASDELLAFLTLVGLGDAVAHLREMESQALYCAPVPLTAAELQDVGMLRELYELVGQLHLSRAMADNGMEEALPTKRRTKPAIVAEDRLLRFFVDWQMPNVLRGLRLVERRAVYENSAGMLEARFESFYFLRALIDRIEALRCAEES